MVDSLVLCFIHTFYCWYNMVWGICTNKTTCFNIETNDNYGHVLLFFSKGKTFWIETVSWLAKCYFFVFLFLFLYILFKATSIIKNATGLLKLSEPNNNSLLAPCLNTSFPLSTYSKSRINDRKAPSSLLGPRLYGRRLAADNISRGLTKSRTARINGQLFNN